MNDSLPVPVDGHKSGSVCESLGLDFFSFQQEIPYIPSEDDPTLYVNVNLIFIAKDDGSGMFGPNDPEHVQIWEDIETKVNAEFSPLSEPNYSSDPACFDPNSDFVSDSKVQFIFTPIYLNSTQYYDLAACSASSVRNILQGYLDDVNLEIDCHNSINITMPTDSMNLNDILNNGAAYESCFYPNATLPSYYNLSDVGYVHLPNLYSKYMWMKTVVPFDPEYNEPWDPVVRNWFVGSVAETVAHELGHCLGLHHYNGVHGANQCSHSIMNQGSNTSGNYLPPTEVGKMHRALAHSSVRSTVSEMSYSSVPITITEDEVWDRDRKLYRPIYISEGATLTVTCKLLFHPDAKIVVAQGGRLVVDGGILTGHCDKLWEGIEVWGNTSQHQYSNSSGLNYQGHAIFKNDAVVENARTAVKNWQPGNWDSRGGIIQASNSTFLNCKRMIEFVAYENFNPQNPNETRRDRSQFELCNFERNDEYPELLSYPPFAMITMWGTHGVQIKGCDFLTSTSVPSSEDRSKAIYSIDANFTVDGFCPGPIQQIPCSNLVPSTFNGFNTAIHATGALNNVAPVIRNADFEKNMVGILFDEAHHATALFNKFIVGGHPFSAPSGEQENAYYHTAIIADQSSSYIIEENEVYSDLTTTYSTHGIVVVNCGDESLELYKNSFNGLSSASIAIGNNQDIEGAYGLRFICNKNVGNEHDFELRSDNGMFSYIDVYQSGLDGYLQAAGNTFSAGDGSNSNFVHIDFYSDDDYLYRYDETTAFETPLDDEINVSDGSFTKESGGTPNGCPSNFPDGLIDVISAQQEFFVEKDAYYNLVYTYHQYIDDGNTEGTLNDIALAWPEDVWWLRNQLMSRSPYNSDSVLIAAADRNILPHGMLLEILIANPDALRGGRVINHVQCCIADPMPQYMVDILESAKDVRTARTIMEHNISNLHAKMARAHRQVMLAFRTDSILTSTDTLLSWYDQMKTRTGRYGLVIEHLAQGNYSNANLALDSIDNSFRLNDRQKIEMTETRKYVTLIESLYNSGRTIAELDSAEVLQLKAIANQKNGGLAASRADNILCYFYGVCKLPYGGAKSMSNTPKKPKPKLEELLAEQNKVLIMPNPADQYVELECTLLFKKENTYLNIWDMNGRMIHSWKLGNTNHDLKVLDTRKFDSGIYLVELVQEGERLLSNKFIVKH